MWLSRTIGSDWGFWPPAVPGIRAHKSPRPGAYSNTLFSIPSSSRIFLKNAIALISLPGGFVVSTRRYSCIHVTARSEYCCMCSGGIFEDASRDSSPKLKTHREKATIPTMITARFTLFKMFLLTCVTPITTVRLPLGYSAKHAVDDRRLTTRRQPFRTQFLYQVSQNYPPTCTQT